MTDLHKAIDFARECLKWPDVAQSCERLGTLIHSSTGIGFYLNSQPDLNAMLESFLGKRFSIQINRGTSSLFKWHVIVGLQNRVSGPPLMFDQGRGDGNDMYDAIFDACVAAIRLYPNATEAIYPSKETPTSPK